MSDLILGCVWLLFGTLSIIFNTNAGFLQYGFFVFSLLYLGKYFYNYTQQYIRIENGVLQLNRLFKKSMALKDIRQIKKFAGDYTLTSEHHKITINTQIIHKDDLDKLDKVLDELGMKEVKS